ncbi:hypothetical protein [Maribacter hydrothermalis]|uniref:Uncharacterized protein n=1 Tax=Maribacter hydrothermalis TaxID=1836467 RepID=A0A1B7ZEA2_9FLAO|nr:hypothetical protein [Maribacter hydrothermalis]APQ17400.1 hypothetical protein BTR34_08720 [Maribacter hydrothermalis]OBR41878.1 hypothetical protein A9200_00365 [Maribacter hydrothermalis]
MNNFEDLQNKWQSQSGVSATEDGFKSLLKSVKAIEKKQKTGNIVLTLTILILVAFLVYVSGYENVTFLLGIGLMIGSLVARIGLELYSLKKLRNIDFSKNARTFKVDLTKYYSLRKYTHYLLTPLAIIIYAVGFIILLPLFKASLSSGFYIYILVSSVVFLFVFSVFIYKQIKFELNKLKELNTKD